MRICQNHWRQLRKAIEGRGLSSLIAQSGKEAVDSVMRQAEGMDTPADFDPLMSANFAIWAAYTRDVGLEAFSDDRCPLCKVEESREGLAANWIEGAAEDQLQYARGLGLVAGPQ